MKGSRYKTGGGTRIRLDSTNQLKTVARRRLYQSRARLNGDSISGQWSASMVKIR
jgi:hypothetical protein